MKKDSRSMEVANFICRFGDHAVLIDFLPEIVAPAFLDQTYNRSFDDTSYFFYDVSIVKFPIEGGAAVPALVGRFIKDTQLKREQVFKKGVGLVADKAKLASSPSAIFVLLLDNHRLLYVRETADGPSLSSFRSTTLAFLKQSRRSFIRKLLLNYRAKRKTNSSLEKLTAKNFSTKIPQPTLEIIPLASESSIEDFIKQFDILKRLQITLVKPNNDQDNTSFFVEWREKGSQLNSSASALVYSNPKDGLDKKQVVEEISKIGGIGNHKVNLRGTDEIGDALAGNNDKFSLKVDLGTLSGDVRTTAKNMYGAFLTLVGGGLIKVEKATDEVVERLKDFITNVSGK